MDAPRPPQWHPLPRPGARAAEAAPVLLSSSRLEAGGERARAFLERFSPAPPVVDGDVEAFALRLGPGGAIDEHAADEPILLLAVAGCGRTRVGGAGAPWQPLAPGEAMLWPAGAPHGLEAEEEGLEVRLVHLGRRA